MTKTLQLSFKKPFNIKRIPVTTNHKLKHFLDIYFFFPNNLIQLIRKLRIQRGIQCTKPFEFKAGFKK